MTDGASTLELGLRLVLSLGLVLGMVGGAMHLLRRRGIPGFQAGTRRGELEVVERKGLSKGASIALVRVGDRTVLVGVTEQRVELLGEAGATAPAALESTTAHTDEGAPAPAVVDVTTTVTRHTTPSGATRHASGARRTGFPSMARQGHDQPARMGFLEAMREMTVRRS